jgi:hypothetical protein
MMVLALNALLATVPNWVPKVAPWLGLVTVTLVLVIAFRNRWQRTPVLARCVILSLYAHVLFALLAISTNYFGWSSKVVGKPGTGTRDIHVRLANDITSESTEEALSHDEPLPESEPLPLDPPELLPEPQLVESQANPATETVEQTPETPAEASLFTELPRMEVQTKASDSPSQSEAFTNVAELLAEVAPRYAEQIDTTSATPAPAAEVTVATREIPKPTKPTTVPELYRLRFNHNAAQLAAAGGSPDTEAAVNLALAWLASNQERDGHWSAARHEAGRGNPQLGQERGDTGVDADTGITALALLAFLGAGQTHLEGEHRVVVQKGLEYLLAAQHSNGSLAGNAKLFASMYCHGMATFALSEAMAITRDQRLRPFVERAIAYTVASQHARGGWRYQPGDVGDMSQFGWQIMALNSAELAGVTVPAATKERSIQFLNATSSGRAGGLASYRAGERTSRTMTAEAYLCRHLLGTRITPETTQETVSFLMQELPTNRSANVYYWYYGTLAMRFAGGREWQTWNEALQNELLFTQRQNGTAQGSWNPDSSWGSYGGRVYQTALSALCLEAYYRYDTASESVSSLR